MIGIGKIQIPAAVRFLQQALDKLLPHPTPLVFTQAPMAGVGGGRDVMG
jgi:hypothetical protein